jgi:hypothetical protein
MRLRRSGLLQRRSQPPGEQQRHRTAVRRTRHRLSRRRPARAGAARCRHPADHPRPEPHHLLRRRRDSVPAHRPKASAHHRQGPGCPAPDQVRAARTSNHRRPASDMPRRSAGRRRTRTGVRSAPPRHGELTTIRKCIVDLALCAYTNSWLSNCRCDVSATAESWKIMHDCAQMRACANALISTMSGNA